jgi:hypothetical protein
MPTPLRRSGSGLLQIPRPGLLPSPNYAWLGPLGPSRVVLSTRQSSLSLRPAAVLLLASPPGSRRTPEVDYRAPLAACPGGTLTHWSIGPSLGTPQYEPRRLCPGLPDRPGGVHLPHWRAAAPCSGRRLTAASPPRRCPPGVPLPGEVGTQFRAMQRQAWRWRAPRARRQGKTEALTATSRRCEERPGRACLVGAAEAK